MGRLGFTEYFFLLLTGREATEQQRYFLDLLLVAIAEHGMMPTVLAARMTLAADPGSLQGALAAGILGCGPVILGTSELCGRAAGGGRSEGRGRRRAGAVARALVRGHPRRRAARRRASAIPCTSPVDPRAERILALADERGVSGTHVGAGAAHSRAPWPRSGASRWS